MPNDLNQMLVLSSTAMKTVIDDVAAPFENAHGLKLVCQFGPSGRMAKLVGEGASNDVAIVSGEGIDELIAAGRIVPGTRTDIARSSIGVAVPKGAPRPDISTVQTFRQALLDAKSVATSNPTGGAQSGAHLATVFERLGLTGALRDKTIYGPGGPAGLIGNFLLRGEADLGLQQLPELLAVPGIDIVGPLPAELQLNTVFSAGISTGASDPDAARAWIAHLRGPLAVDAIRARGMEPA